MNTFAWVVLREQLAEIKRQTGYVELALPAQRILEWIFAQQGRSSPILICTVIEESSVASPSVCHTAIRLLINQGLLKVKVDPADTRRRILIPTLKALELMGLQSSVVLKLAAAIKASVKNPSNLR